MPAWARPCRPVPARPAAEAARRCACSPMTSLIKPHSPICALTRGRSATAFRPLCSLGRQILSMAQPMSSARGSRQRPVTRSVQLSGMTATLPPLQPVIPGVGPDRHHRTVQSTGRTDLTGQFSHGRQVSTRMYRGHSCSQFAAGQCMDHVPTLRFVGKRCGAEALTYHLLPVKAQQHWPSH